MKPSLMGCILMGCIRKITFQGEHMKSYLSIRRSPNFLLMFRMGYAVRIELIENFFLTKLSDRHSPMICKITVRSLDRVSISNKTTCCQVPNVNLLCIIGIVILGPISDERTWE